MIPARHHRLSIWFVRFVYRLLFRLFFRKVEIAAVGLPDHGPVLLIGNHFSWWDGFFADYLNLKLFKRKLHIMMLEEQLRPRMFLNRAGAFSIRPGTRDIVASFRYAAETLNSRDTLLVIYPQGKIQSMHRLRFAFEKGVEKLALSGKQEFHLMFYCALADYFSSVRPSVRIYLGSFPSETIRSVEALASSYNNFYLSCLEAQDKLT